jgi:hypothetical protein
VATVKRKTVMEMVAHAKEHIEALTVEQVKRATIATPAGGK